jgi:hypothetical protein
MVGHTQVTIVHPRLPVDKEQQKPVVDTRAHHNNSNKLPKHRQTTLRIRLLVVTVEVRLVDKLGVETMENSWMSVKTVTGQRLHQTPVRDLHQS